MLQHLDTTAYYANRDPKWQHEKPYQLQFPAPDGFPETNMTWTQHSDVQVADIRGVEGTFTVHRHGFQLCNLDTRLTYEDMGDRKKVEEIYLPEVAESLKKELKADRVLVFDYNVGRLGIMYSVCCLNRV